MAQSARQPLQQRHINIDREVIGGVILANIGGPNYIYVGKISNKELKNIKEEKIMKRIFSAVLLTLILAGAAFGLSDKEYKQMMKSSKAFREADKFMNDSYKECRQTLPRSEFERIKEEQREWIKSGRDEEAQSFIDDGMKRAEAYAKVTEMRAHDLHHLCVTYRNAN